MKLLSRLSLLIIISLLSACGFHFKTGQLLPEGLRTMQFKTADKYSNMSRIMRQTLRLNDIKLVENSQNVPVFYLLGDSDSSDVSALFSTGKEAEKVMILQVDAEVIMPNGTRYPISTKVANNFFDSPQEALAKSTEKDAIWQDLRQRAATQLVHRLFSLKNVVENPTKTTPVQAK